ncbi:hypothetical protein Scep_016231 [Stephania cephalantha]|uniref:Uncharacterized protein n=1 Tax=Stephania cephalantha TaxID=152367 RepID=A0AAP0IM91_9MAGN
MIPETQSRRSVERPMRAERNPPKQQWRREKRAQPMAVKVKATDQRARRTGKAAARRTEAAMRREEPSSPLSRVRQQRGPVHAEASDGGACGRTQSDPAARKRGARIWRRRRRRDDLSRDAAATNNAAVVARDDDGDGAAKVRRRLTDCANGLLRR